MESRYVEFPSKGNVVVKTEDVSGEGLAPMEVLIRNETSIISAGTELARLNGLEGDFPARPGYGSIGRIEAKGEGISDFDVGDRVFYAGTHASVQRFTHGEDHQWAYLFPVPEEIDPVDASVVCMAEISATASFVTELRPGDTVAVFGLGLIGILAAQQYRILGATVIGVDPVAKRCAQAKEVGIDTVIDAPPDKQVEAVKAVTEGTGAQVTVDATGLTPVVLSCIQSTALFGQVVLLGSPRASYEADVTIPFNRIHMEGLVVRGAHMWRFPVRTTRTTPRSVEWLCATTLGQIMSGQLTVRPLISHVIGPDEVPETYDGLMNRRDEYTGAVIDWR